MTDEQIMLEYEMYLVCEGKKLVICSQCGFHTHQTRCPRCGIEATGDATFDSIIADLEAGKQVNLDELLRGESWEEVKIGES